MTDALAIRALRTLWFGLRSEGLVSTRLLRLSFTEAPVAPGLSFAGLTEPVGRGPLSSPAGGCWIGRHPARMCAPRSIGFCGLAARAGRLPDPDRRSLGVI